MRTRIVVKGDYKKADRFFKGQLDHKYLDNLDKYGKMGVEALSAATPVRTGKTAASWSYRIVKNGHTVSLLWENSNKSENGDNIVMLLVKGHGTRNGTYYRGHDFVSLAIQPVFDLIAKEVVKEVK